jgi:TonB-dependent starch-binding outer membrane protein SusC
MTLFRGVSGFPFALCIMCMCFINSIASLAQFRFTGKVADQSGHPLSGVTVLGDRSNVLTTTDSIGNFALSAGAGATIEFSYVGFSRQRIVLDQTIDLNIVMVEEAVTLEEIIVIGYGTASRKNLSASIDRVSKENFIEGNLTNPLQHLQGQVAGLSIVRPGGDPNGDFIVRVRGATSIEGQPPLLVIDGVAMDDFHRGIAAVNPSDIESYDILKDAAAAAIFGSRGANGVIIITTRKGKTGKAVFEYNGFGTVEKISNKFNLLSADQWRKATEGWGFDFLDQGANTDWQEEMSRTAYTQNHALNISGGSEEIQFSGSIGYLKQDGVILNTGKDALTTRMIVTQSALNDKLALVYNFNSSTIRRGFLPDQTSTGQVREGGAFVFSYSPSLLPVLSVTNPDGSYFLPPGFLNPVFLLKELYSKQKQNLYQGSVKADYELKDWIQIGMLSSITKTNDTYDRFWPELWGLPSVGTKAASQKVNYSGNMNFEIHKNSGRHDIRLIGVYEYNRFMNEGFGVNAGGFLSDDLLTNNLGTASTITTNDILSFKNEIRIISFLGRVVYNFDNRYILTANYRRDGSSKFGPNNRWSDFPSLSMAWRVSQEQFMQGTNWINDLKLRISYGLTGNQENLPPNKYQALYLPTGPYLVGGRLGQSYGIAQEFNPDLKWEVRRSFNVGLDFSLFQNKLNGAFEVFNDHSDDMLFLYNIPQPPFISNRVYANAANSTNEGVELTIGSTILSRKNFQWNVNGNFSKVKNRITELLGEFKSFNLSIDQNYGYASGGALGYSPVSRLTVGYPAGTFWLPEHAGIDESGAFLYAQYDESGNYTGTGTTYEDRDRKYIDPTPDFIWGFTNKIRFRNFDLDIFFRGVQGQKIFANSLMNLESMAYLPFSNVSERALTNGFVNLPEPSTYWIRDGSFIRLENISLAYRWPTEALRHLRIYVSAHNLFVSTNYDGIDPEVNTDGPQRYIDGSYYPRTKGVTLGVNVGF